MIAELPMTLHRSDYDQAARYLRYACELLERQAFGKTATLREVLQMAARRLSPGDNYVGDAAAEITVLRQVAEKVPIADSRTEILKAIAVLRTDGLLLSDRDPVRFLRQLSNMVKAQ
jgi:hypothetical protein